MGFSGAERVVHLMLWCKGKGGNGGHLQYLLNPAGVFANETIDTRNALKAFEAARILADVVALFPGKVVPRDRSGAYGIC